MLSARQSEIITGSLLGDGCIVKNENRFHFQIGQSKFDHIDFDKRSYLTFYESEFEDFGTFVSEETIKPSGFLLEYGKQDSYYRYTFRLKSLPYWQKCEKNWYVSRHDHHYFKRRKIVPSNIRLSPLTLTIWHMEDGCNNPKDANIELNTQGFTRDEVNFLIEKLKQDLGITSWEKRDHYNYKIFVGRKSYFDFIEMIKPNIAWDCFTYKIDTSAYDKQPHKGENHSNSKLTELQVDEIFKLRQEGLLQKNLADKFGVSRTAISLILSGDRWGREGNVKRKPRLSKETRQRIIDMSGKSQKEIAQELGVNQSTVCRILKGL